MGPPSIPVPPLLIDELAVPDSYVLVLRLTLIIPPLLFRSSIVTLRVSLLIFFLFNKLFIIFRNYKM